MKIYFIDKLSHVSLILFFKQIFRKTATKKIKYLDFLEGSQINFKKGRGRVIINISNRYKKTTREKVGIPMSHFPRFT